MDSPVAIAPPVVAVVVVHDPGPWFDEVLAAISAQDYPSLRVLALVTAGFDDAADRIRSVLPDAYVRAIDGNVGFGPAANEVLRLVEGGGFFCFLHDDVALAPDAVSVLVAELYRSNAGIVGPKLVEWDQPAHLLTVGLPIDKFGEFSSPVEAGELDQEQHDAIRDVFSLPSACLLVRADLFRALGGFDPEIPFFGEALDLCWRAHASGARVLVVPDAVARHRQAIETRNADLDPGRLAERHRLRTVLSGYGRLHLIRVIPQYAVVSLADAVVRVVTGRPAEAGAVLGAWPWNMARAGSLVAKRRALRGLRSVPDRELRGLQVRGSARLATFVRAQGARRDDRVGAVTSAGRGLVHRLRTGERRASIGVWVLAVLVFLVGSRTLITGHVPVVGELLPYSGSATGMIRTYLSGWWAHGLGGAVPVPTGIGLIGAAGTVLFGRLGLLHTLLVVGPILLGWIGTWRLLAPFAVQRARITGLAVVAGTPLAVNALATGHWSGVLAFGAAPFALGRLGRVSGLEPFDGRHRPFAVHVAALGLLLAVVGAFVPSFPLVIVAVAVAIVVGSLAAGGVRQSTRALAAALAAALLGYLLNLPWTSSLVYPGARWAPIGSLPLTEGHGRSLASLAVFDTGPHTFSFFALAGYLAALAALAVGRSWRFAWAARAWAVIVGLLALTWAGQRGWLPVTLPDVEVVLAPVAIALGLAAACGGAASELDVRSTRLTWRQPVLFVATAAAIVAALPIVVAAADGRWKAPSSDLTLPLSTLPNDPADGAFRTLWIGDPRALPLAGWELAPGLAYGLTDGLSPSVAQAWPSTPTTPELLVRDALRAAARGDTTRLGRLLAPMAIRYVIVPTDQRPVDAGAARYPVPAPLTTTLSSQLDLHRIELGGSLVVYENTSRLPERAQLSATAATASQQAGFASLAAADLSGSKPVLAGGERAGRGPVGAGEVFMSVPLNSGWRLTVDGSPTVRRPAFGWATAFVVPAAGSAHLTYATSPARRLAIAAQLLLWIIALRVALHRPPADGRSRRVRRAERRLIAAAEAPVLIDLGSDVPMPAPVAVDEEPDEPLAPVPVLDTRADDLGLRWGEPTEGEP